jgi:aarF domain-containing kinase
VSHDESDNWRPPTGASERAARLLRMTGRLATQEITRRMFGKFAGDLDDRALRLRQAATLVRELGHLKGAAMKAGQMLVLEARDYLPEEVVQVLERLQADAPPMGIATVREILREDLGDRAARLEGLSTRPVAAASIGQVHRARYEGREVAVKVQYPAIRLTLKADLQVLGTVLKGAGALFRRDTNFEGIISEFSEVFLQEADYAAEATLLRDYRAAAASTPHLLVPAAYDEVCGPRVLTLDFVQGLTLPEWMRRAKPSLETRARLGQRILALFTQEFCDWGLVQTDPNLGNFLVSPDERLVLLDFGATKRYSAEFRREYARLLMAVHRQDVNELDRATDALALIDPRESAEARDIFRRLVRESMGPLTLERFDFQDEQYLTRVRAMSRELASALRYSPPPRNLIFLHRKLGGIFQMLKLLRVELDLRGYLRRFEEIA